MKTHTCLSLCLSAIAAGALTAAAQVTLTGTSYSENFNALGSGLPAGWSVRTNASATGLGTPASFTSMATNWAASSGQFANYASTLSNSGTNFLGTEAPTNQVSCTNRCLGLRQTGSFGDPGAAFVFQIRNTLGFTGLQLRLDCNLLSAQNRSTAWTIDCAIGNNPDHFTTLDTWSDPGAFGSTIRTASLGAAADNQDQNVWIRIVALDAATGTGSRDTMGIDNFRLDYQPVGVVAPVPLAIRASGGSLVVTWSNAAFGLQSAPAIEGAFTNVPGAASPYSAPASDRQKYFRLKAN